MIILYQGFSVQVKGAHRQSGKNYDEKLKLRVSSKVMPRKEKKTRIKGFGPISLNVCCMDNVSDQNCRIFNFLNLKANSDYISDL